MVYRSLHTINMNIPEDVDPSVWTILKVQDCHLGG
jgi:hypothetical protein